MKTTHTLMAAALIAAAMAVAARTGSAAGAAVGQPAPGFTLSDADGAERSLQELSGKHVVLEWFNNDCPFVKKHYDSGNMQKLQADATGKGVVWLTINSSAPGKQGHLTPESAKEIIQARGSRQTALLLDPDGAVGKSYGAKTTPHMYIIDPAGTLIYMGGIDDKPSTNADDIPSSTNYVRQALDQALAGQPVATASTESYGCSVKYAE
jgi:peroxiredoxin